MNLDDPAHFQNRDLAWLDFNARVLAEAENAEVPLLERAKFTAIVSSNLDEFFMVRVAILRRAAEAGAPSLDPDRMSPRSVLDEISVKAHHLVQQQYACFEDVLRPALAQNGVEIIESDNYTPEDIEFIRGHFRDQVHPVLTPLAVDSAHPFPQVANCAVYTLFKIEPMAEREKSRFYAQTDTVLVQVPPGMNRFLRLPARRGHVRLARLGDVIIQSAPELLRGYQVKEAYTFRVTRDADISVDEEATENLLASVEQELRSRRTGAPVRLEVGREMPDHILTYLQERLSITEPDTYRVPSFLDLKCLFGLLDLVDRPDLRDEPWPPQPHPALQEAGDIFSLMRKRDLLFHHPYQSFDPVVNMVTQAAEDPDVLAIKITLYRVSGDSPIVRALIRAAENGKQVTALVELRARFDEAANIQWARRLDTAGAHVIYGVVGYKTHSKALLIVRKEEEGIRRYVHLSTGNYNDRTALLYTDMGYLTTRPEFGSDISAFFNVVTGYSLPPNWNHIEMAPTGLRRRFLHLIEREIEKHSPEAPGFIRAKMNSLIDPDIIKALYKASQAGVKIELVVRGMSRLRAGVKGLSENIRLISILDRFLEHARIYHFRNGGQEEVYLASADWMERNMDRRLELLFPILDRTVRAKVLRALDVALQDNVKAWEMQPDGSYKRVKRSADHRLVHSQAVTYRTAVREGKKAVAKRAAIMRVADSRGSDMLRVSDSSGRPAIKRTKAARKKKA